MVVISKVVVDIFKKQLSLVSFRFSFYQTIKITKNTKLSNRFKMKTTKNLEVFHKNSLAKKNKKVRVYQHSWNSF